MREIKFRAYDKITKKMYSSNEEIEDITSTGSHVGPFGNFDDLEYWQSFELMQYTGLKDKNGKEIYEGDVVRCNEISKAIIEYSDGAFRFTANSMFEGECLGDYDCARIFEVDGNIYENTELIK